MGQIYGNDLGKVMNENMTQDVISLFRSGVLREQKGILKKKGII
jgi:hypothetical protein